MAVVAIVGAKTIFGVDEQEAAGSDDLEEVCQRSELFAAWDVFEDLIAKDDVERAAPIVDRERLAQIGADDDAWERVFAESLRGERQALCQRRRSNTLCAPRWAAAMET